MAADPWPVSDAAYAALIDLCVDICQRNNIKQLLWQGDKNLIGQVGKQNMTVHSWFAAKACPGDYLYNRHGAIAEEVNKRLTETTTNNTVKEDDKMLTQEQFEEMYANMIAKTHGDKPSTWAKEACAAAQKAGIFNGDGDGNYDWQEPLTREACAVILYNSGIIK